MTSPPTLTIVFCQVFREASPQFPVLSYAVVTTSVYSDGGSHVVHPYLCLSIFIAKWIKRKMSPDVNRCDCYIHHFPVDEPAVARSSIFLQRDGVMPISPWKKGHAGWHLCSHYFNGGAEHVGNLERVLTRKTY